MKHSQLFWCSLSLFLASSLCADEGKQYPVRRVRLVDQDGRAISKGHALPWLVNERYFWPVDQLNDQASITNQEGIADIKYPLQANFIETLPVESIKMTVVHPDFCALDVVVPVGEEDSKPFEIKLKPGVQLSLSAVDEVGEPVKEPFAVKTTSRSFDPRWHRPTPNQAVSRGIPAGNCQIMLVQPKKDGQHKFSETLSYRFDLTKEPVVAIDDVELVTGIKVHGKLADRVTRPVKNGKVIAVQAPLPAGDSWDEKLPSLLYYESTEVRPDGTFEFPSMPRTGTIQLISLCDGWVGKAKNNTFIIGQSFAVEDKDLDVELEMDRSYDAHIRLLDQEQNPLAGMSVGGSPSQLYEKGGSTILGQSNDTMPVLQRQLTDEPDRLVGLNTKSFQAVSDQEGRLVIRNLPRNRFGSEFMVWYDANSANRQKIAKSDLKGQLPDDDEDRAEFDLVVELEK